MPNLNNAHGCTLGTCPIQYATVDYVPSLAGNALFLALFTAFFFIQAFQLWKYRTWSYSFAMMMGLVLEVVGYVGRVQMHFNPFLPDPFLMYLICLTIAPVFFAASLYLTYSRALVHYGPAHSRFSPKVVSLTFMSSDFVALLLQSAGGAIADTAPTESGSMAGTHIMVAGLAFQVLSLLCFIGLAVEFALSVTRAKKTTGVESAESGTEGGKASSASERGLGYLIAAFALATLLILTRSAFRVGELAKGFGSKLANEEIPFMVLEGAMIVLAAGLMTAAHPGMFFGVKWKNAGWTWKKAKRTDIEREGAGVWEAVSVEGGKESRK